MAFLSSLAGPRRCAARPARSSRPLAHRARDVHDEDDVLAVGPDAVEGRRAEARCRSGCRRARSRPAPPSAAWTSARPGPPCCRSSTTPTPRPCRAPDSCTMRASAAKYLRCRTPSSFLAALDQRLDDARVVVEGEALDGRGADLPLRGPRAARSGSRMPFSEFWRPDGLESPASAMPRRLVGPGEVGQGVTSPGRRLHEGEHADPVGASRVVLALLGGVDRGRWPPSPSRRPRAVFTRRATDLEDVGRRSPPPRARARRGLRCGPWAPGLPAWDILVLARSRASQSVRRPRR